MIFDNRLDNLFERLRVIVICSVLVVYQCTNSIAFAVFKVGWLITASTVHSHWFFAFRTSENGIFV